jgi:hypothetical protein
MDLFFIVCADAAELVSVHHAPTGWVQATATIQEIAFHGIASDERAALTRLLADVRRRLPAARLTHC